LLWLDPEPAEEELPALYRDYYTHSAKVDQTKGRRRWLRDLYRASLKATRIVAERRKLQLLFIDELPPGELLEVGCGSGGRLPLFKALGWRVTGQDVDPVAAGEARRTTGAEVHVGPIEELARTQRRFNAIVVNHVIEHVVDPVALLRVCRSMLRPRGALICVTPNASSWGHRRFGANWMSLDPPRHISLFTPSALRMASRMAGYESEEVLTSCANVEAFALGSFEIAAKGRYDMNGAASWRSQALAAVAQLRALREFRKDPQSGDELVLRWRAP
jgi:2-polyprenyl-3-methyl-5-hydroxy-6-metoxy-1,4-benzoquinol methylase